MNYDEQVAPAFHAFVACSESPIVKLLQALRVAGPPFPLNGLSDSRYVEKNMISSLIARLNTDARPLASTIAEIESKPGAEIGDLVDNRLLPVTLEALNSQEMEDATRWIQGLAGVDFVDVVYVHFDEVVPVDEKA